MQRYYQDPNHYGQMCAVELPYLHDLCMHHMLENLDQFSHTLILCKLHVFATGPKTSPAFLCFFVTVMLVLRWGCGVGVGCGGAC